MTFNRFRTKYADKITHFALAYLCADALAHVGIPLLVAATIAICIQVGWELVSWKANTLKEHAFDTLASIAGVIIMLLFNL